MAGDVIINDKGVEVQGDLTADADVKIAGNLTAKKITYTIVQPSYILGHAHSDMIERTLYLSTRDVALTWQKYDKDGKLIPVVAGDDSAKQNIALSHADGNKLVVNRGQGFTGGTYVDGNLEIHGRLILNGKDVTDLLAKL